MALRSDPAVLSTVLFYVLSLSANGPFPLPPKNDASSQSSAQPSRKPCVEENLEILTDTEGIDFNSYLRSANHSIEKAWLAVMPRSALLGQWGRNAVTFRVSADGSVPNESIGLENRSGKIDLDKASLKAVRNAAPFDHLPEKFSGPFIVLRARFVYNAHSDSK
jgi:TonB family protein